MASKSISAALILLVIFGFSVSANAQSRTTPPSGLFHKTWKLKGPFERRFDGESALLNLKARQTRGKPIGSKTIIENQHVNIENQRTYGATTIGNNEEITVIDSNEVTIVSDQSNEDSNINTTMNTSEGGAVEGATNNTVVSEESSGGYKEKRENHKNGQY